MIDTHLCNKTKVKTLTSLHTHVRSSIDLLCIRMFEITVDTLYDDRVVSVVWICTIMCYTTTMHNPSHPGIPFQTTNGRLDTDRSLTPFHYLPYL